MTTSRAFFLQIRILFSNFQKRAGETSPPPPSSYAPVPRAKINIYTWIKSFLFDILPTFFSFSCLIFYLSDNQKLPSGCSIKEAAQKKTLVLESLFHKTAALEACNFIKKRLQHRCFAVNIAKFLRTPILKNICKWQLLHNKFQRLSSVWQSSINLSFSESLSFLLAILISYELICVMYYFLI